jgi:hypothetical protein
VHRSLSHLNKQSLYNLEIALRAAVAAGRSRSDARTRRRSHPIDLFLCIVDHYEPQVGRPPRALARERVEDWLRRYPQIASAHRDAEGRSPAHSFFYPWDEYDAWELSHIAELCAAGYGEIDLHLHHQDDTETSLRGKLRKAVQVYREHGVLPTWPDGRPAWGFIHGDWALDNSRCERGRNYCGVNNELTVLQEEGCYADFTFPAWQHLAQPRQMNSIHYAVDDPDRPKSYDTGRRARVNTLDPKGLLLVQGPLVPYIGRSGRGRRLAMDDGDLAACRRYEPARLDRWVQAGIQVQGRADRIFIKLHSHGAEDRNRAVMLGEDLEALFTDAETRYNDGQRYRLHYITARELFNVIKATEAGVEDILAARDWLLKPPASTDPVRKKDESALQSGLAYI